METEDISEDEISDIINDGDLDPNIPDTHTECNQDHQPQEQNFEDTVTDEAETEESIAERIRSEARTRSVECADSQ